MLRSFNWTCPYCKNKTTIVNSNFHEETHFYDSPSKMGFIGITSSFIVCPNQDCKELVVHASLYKAEGGPCNPRNTGSPLLTWNLKPESSAVPLPSYIPKALIKDYTEACKILSLSPKASATLSRRCLQGMIRDFWKISKSTLFDEISELEGKIDELTWDSINAVRSIGNIGAHMGKDVNLIIDIDENEAKLLITLIEELFQDWYMNKHEKEKRHKEIIKIAEKKKKAKKSRSLKKP